MDGIYIYSREWVWGITGTGWKEWGSESRLRNLQLVLGALCLDGMACVGALNEFSSKEADTDDVEREKPDST
jgi:hypothetical protein